jgi:demethylmenaquinone methyltransferase/2-methoxy-6-polyprenyl-1,4-benzoquinol methylase
MKNDKDKIRGMFRRISSKYDFLNTLLSLNIDTCWRKRAAGFLQGENGYILDLCCGTHKMGMEVLDAGMAFRGIIGVDFCLEMLLEGKKRTEVNSSCMVSVCGDAETLPFKDRAFSGVIMAFGLRNIIEKGQALRECCRVLKEGGSFVILEFSIPDSSLIRPLYLFYFKYILAFVGGMISGDKDAYTYLPDSVMGFSTPDSIRAMLKDAGFSGISSTPLTWGIVTVYAEKKDKANKNLAE